jgi:Flp pilus assembly protein TadG
MMNHIFSKAKATIRGIPSRRESGQALIELALVSIVLITLTFGLIDFYRALYEKEVLTNLSREAANESARGSGTTTSQIMSNAMIAVANSSESFALNFNNVNGVLILTAVTNVVSGNKNSITNHVISQQMHEGELTATSKIGTSVGSAATLPKPTGTLPSILGPNRTVYIAEIYYSYTPVTPIGKLIKIAMTNRFYDVAYFPGG